MNESKLANPYTTRVQEMEASVPRADPVVYRDSAPAANAPLDEKALATFEEKGYLFFEDLFSAEEVAALNDELERLIGNEIVRQSEISVTEATSGEIRTIYAAQTVSQVFARLSRDPRLLGVAQQILGGDVYLHQTRVSLKPGFYGREYNWHSDFETWHAEDGMPRMRALSFSIAITENKMLNGPMMMIPGSHKHFIPCQGQAPEGHQRVSLKRQEFGVPSKETITELVEQYGIEVPTGPAGSVVMYDCNVLHGSSSNITPYARANAFLVYNHVDNSLVEPFAAQDARPWYFANREPDALTPKPFGED